MSIAKVSITNVELSTKLKVRKEAAGRSRTSQQRTYTLELSDGSTALYFGNGSFKRSDKLLLVSKEGKDGKKRIIAYQNLSQNIQGPTAKEQREAFSWASFIILLGLLSLILGLTESAVSPSLIGLGILVFAMIFLKPALDSARGLQKIRAYLQQ